MRLFLKIVMGLIVIVALLAAVLLIPPHLQTQRVEPPFPSEAELRALLAERGAACVFAEPQFNPALVAAMTEGSGARVATLDPLGAALTPGPEAYFVLMRDLAEALVRCLKGGE